MLKKNNVGPQRQINRYFWCPWVHVLPPYRKIPPHFVTNSKIQGYSREISKRKIELERVIVYKVIVACI